MKHLHSLNNTFRTFFSSNKTFDRMTFSKGKAVFYSALTALIISIMPLFASQTTRAATDFASSSGAFMLPVPIEVPPGRAGIQPKLTLTYNSQGLQSWVGTGWSLGMGAIHRDLKEGVKYEVGAYAISNSKLIRVTDWDKDGYHAYAPEVQKDFTKYFKILDTSNEDDQTLGWEVHSKDGKIFYYGTTAASRQDATDATGDTKVFKWCLDKVLGANGNAMSISYTKDENGQIYLDRINYTGVLDQDGNVVDTTNEVIFHLEARDDHNSSYVSNYEVKTKKRLKTIEVKNNDTLVRAYGLEYETSGNSPRSLLMSVTTYGSDANIANGTISSETSLPPHKFEYQNFAVKKSYFNEDPNDNGQINNYGRWSEPGWKVTGDFNGDGNTDILALKKHDGSADLRYLIYDHNNQTFNDPSTEQYKVISPVYYLNYSDVKQENSYFISNDFNRDGKDDLLVYHVKTDDHGNYLPTTYDLYFSTETDSGNPTFTKTDLSQCAVDNDWHYQLSVGDFNGDGLFDLLFTGDNENMGRYKMALFNETKQCFKQEYEGYYSEDGNEDPIIYDVLKPRIGDFNGDGKSDVLLVDARFHGIDKSGYRLFISNGSALVYKSKRVLTETALAKFFSRPKGIGDVNGDGKADLFFSYVDYDDSDNPFKLLVYHSDGENLNPTFDSISDAGVLPPYDADMYVGDFNGDNRNDFILLYIDNSGADFYRLENNKPTKINPTKNTNLTSWFWDYALADYNGDGATDFVTLRYTGLQAGDDLYWRYYHSQENSETMNISLDLLTKHTNSIGGITSIDYKPSSDQDMTDGTMANLHTLPFVLYLVRSVTMDDRVNNTGAGSATFTYTYNDGKYDFPTREFRGFGSIIIENPGGLKTKKYFYQDEDRKGIVNKVKMYTDSEESALMSSIYNWKTDPSSDANTFLYLEKEEKTIDGQTKYMFYEYDDSGNIISLTTSKDSGGNSGIVSKTSYENQNTSKWIWRKEGETLHKKTDGSLSSFKKKTEFVYDVKGNLTSKKSYSNASNYITEKFTYDNSYGNQLTVKDGRGNTTSFIFDSTTNYTYPATKILPAVGGHTALSVSYTYDTAYGAVLTETDGNEQETRYTYNNTDPAKGTLEYFGRKTQVDYPDGGRIRNEYQEYTLQDPNCSSEICDINPSTVKTITKNTNSDESWSKGFFDGMGRGVQTLSSHSSNYVATRTVYDKPGREKKVSGPAVVSSQNLLLDDLTPYVETFYDKLSRPTSKITPNPDLSGTAETKYSYDGYETTITYPDGVEKTETKDYLGRIIQIEECGSDRTDTPVTTAYTYNALNGLTEIAATDINPDDSYENVTTMTYDMLGQKISITSPDSGTTSFEYDQNGNLKKQTDNAGNIADFTYDELNRVTEKSYENSKESVSYTYDTDDWCTSNCIGRLTSTRQSTSSGGINLTRYETYDNMGRIKKMSQTNFDLKRTMETVYDSGGRVTQLIYPYLPGTSESDKTKISYVYYPGTQLIKEVKPSGGSGYYANISAYTAEGNIKTMTFGSELETNYTYDATTANLNQISVKNGASPDIMKLAYTYSSAGNIKTRNDLTTGGINSTYEYDDLRRLTSATTDPAGSVENTHYMYDDIGNITSRQVGDTNYAYFYETGGVHAVTKVTVGDSDTPYSFEYDQNGNLLTGPDLRPGNIKNRKFAYNKDNMPIEIVEKISTPDCVFGHQGKKIRLYYGGGSQRVVKKIWDNHDYVGRVDYFDKFLKQYTPATGENSTTSYIFAGNLRIASLKKTSDSTDPEVHYFHKDHLGSTGVVTDSEGAVLNEIGYLPYGYSDGTSSTDHRFTDQEFDDEVGLYNYKARMYDPMIGRFTTADSIIPDIYSSQSLNRYSYCLNNPIKYTDPSGHFSVGWTTPLAILGTAVTVTIILPLYVALAPAVTAATLVYVSQLTVKKVFRDITIGFLTSTMTEFITTELENQGINSIVAQVIGETLSVASGSWANGTSKIMTIFTYGPARGTLIELSEIAYKETTIDNEEQDYSIKHFIHSGSKLLVKKGTGALGFSLIGSAMADLIWNYGNDSIDIPGNEFILNSVFSSDLSFFGSYEGAMGGYGYDSTINDMRSIVDNFGSDYSWNSGYSWDGGGGWDWSDSGNSLQLAPQGMSTFKCEFSDDFSEDTGMWNYTGYSVDAKRDGSNENKYVVLTEDEYSQAGVIWLDVQDGIKADKIVVDFKYKAGKACGTDCEDEGEGFVMMFFKDTDYVPWTGHNLGFRGEGNYETGYGIEFDSYHNTDDPDSKHIALIHNSTNNHLASVNDIRVDDNEWHNVRVKIATSGVRVFVVDMENPVLSWNDPNDTFLDRTYSGFGFSAATGSDISQTHLIDEVKIRLDMDETYTVTPSVNGNGVISPADPQTVNYDEMFSFTLTSGDERYLASVTGTCGGKLDGNNFTTHPVLADCTVIANFEHNTQTLNISKAGSGRGTVTGSQGSIDCGTDCSETFDYGTIVTLTAAPDENISFLGWNGGGCGGTGNCEVTMYADTVVTAIFGPQCSYSTEKISLKGDMVTTNGDFNGDGYTDLAYGYYLWDFTWDSMKLTKGKVEILYGPDYACTTSFDQDSPGILGVAEIGDQFGYSLASGDFNNDEYEDLAIGIPGENTSTGYVSIIYGSKIGLTSAKNQLISQGSAGISGTPEEGDEFGKSLASGDFDNNGYADLAIGVPGENNKEGWVNIIYGSNSGLTGVGDQMIGQDTDGIRETGEAGDQFGRSLASADFDRDGFADLAVGVPYEDYEYTLDRDETVWRCYDYCDQPCDQNWWPLFSMQCSWTETYIKNNTGLINVIYGSDSGLKTSGNQLFQQGVDHNNQNTNLKGSAEEGDYFGYSLASGDFNGDRYGDVVIGAPWENDNNEGWINVIYGSDSGLTTVGNRMFGQNTDGMRGSGQNNDRFGTSLASGDYNFNGYTDISIWIPGENGEGWISAIYGSNTGLTTEGNQLKRRPWNPWEQQTIKRPGLFLPFVDSKGNLSAIHNKYWDGYDHGYGNPRERWNWALSSRQTWDKAMGVGDADGDGLDDVFIINGDGHITAILTPAPGGSISSRYIGNPKAEWSWDFSSKTSWYKPLGIGDANGDGLDDVIIIDNGGFIAAILTPAPGESMTFLNIGYPLSYMSWTFFSEQTWTKPLGVGHANDDGRIDIFVINGAGDIHVILTDAPNEGMSSLYLGNPITQWGWTLSSLQSLDKPVGIHDVNNDGLDDIIIVNESGGIRAILTPVSGTYTESSKKFIVDASSWGISSAQTEKKPMHFFGWWDWW